MLSPTNGAVDEVSILAAVEQAADCILITDAAGVIEYANPAYSAMTGYSAEEAVGQSTRMHRSGRHGPEFYRDLWGTIQSGRTWQGEITNRRRDGTLYQEEMRITPVRDAAGGIVRYIAIKKDVTGQRSEQELIRNSLEFAQSTIDALASHICVLDGEGTIIAVNLAWREFARANGGAGGDGVPVKSGQPRDLAEGVKYLEVCDRAQGAEAAEAAAFAVGIRAVLCGERDQFSAEYACHSPSQRRWFLGRVTRFAGRHPVRVLIEHIDITERRLVEESLLFKTALLEGQAETTLDGILVVDEADRIVLTNQHFATLFGIPGVLLNTRNDLPVREHVTNKVANPEVFRKQVDYLYGHREEKSWDEIPLTNGTILDRYSAPLVDSTGEYRGRIWYFRDVTARKAAEARSQFLAFHDALTGLPHRALLEDRLNTALAGARRRHEQIALLFLDLDRFKNINDTFGHSYGDELLKDVARRLRELAREQDTVARVGGDEFLVMLDGVRNAADVAIAAERILDAMKAPFLVRGHSLSVGCSIGISLFPEHGTDGETLIKNADAALYSAKDSGRGGVRFFTGQMNERATERLLLEKNLRLALEREEFFLVYQPQVEMESGAIIGFEALLRWQQPEMGLVPPDRFISTAENTGLILPIGEWVLRTACAQARQWHDAGLISVPMAVNVSPVQFRQASFVAMIRKVLAETGLPAELLELELTEGLLLSEVELTFSVLRELKAMGVNLAIDDFGTGYSSLSYLKHFPVNKLKVDRSFVRDIATDSDDAAITIAIISMARSLKLKVIAEGVENKTQVSFLRRHQCDEMQGYFLSRPMTADQVLEKLSSAGGGGDLAVVDGVDANAQVGSAWRAAG